MRLQIGKASGLTLLATSLGVVVLGIGLTASARRTEPIRSGIDKIRLRRQGPAPG